MARLGIEPRTYDLLRYAAGWKAEVRHQYYFSDVTDVDVGLKYALSFKVKLNFLTGETNHPRILVRITLVQLKMAQTGKDPC